MEKVMVVTGGAGFVGSNLVKGLNEKGYSNIVVVDNLSNSRKVDNLKDTVFVDFIDFSDGLENTIKSLMNYDISAIFHIGANADVNISGYSSMIRDNFLSSKAYLDIAVQKDASFLYASSSAVYGNSLNCHVSPKYEKPHNAYAFSKLLFDNYVRFSMHSFKTKVVGLRFFNIFGPGEYHKDKNASMPYRFFEFLKNDNCIELFNEKIERDYIYVGDVVNSIINFGQDDNVENGIYNLGTSQTISHKDLAEIVLDEYYKNHDIIQNDQPVIELIDMPLSMKKVFQFYTKAMDLHPLITSGLSDNRLKVKEYIKDLCKGDR
ncbi:NAD-dependent epimerase/dehydratase family protein [Bacteroidota bacterium]